MVVDRHQFGQWFTPPAVADLALTMALDGCPKPQRLLDPTCGDGAFLDRALHRGIPADSLFGVELDPSTATRARERVPGANISCADIFSLDSEQAPFDVVVGNPPYVRQERIADKQLIAACLRRDWPDVSERTVKALLGRGDLAITCILRALRLARQGARLSFVVSSALVDATYSRALWDFVQRHADVVALVDAPNERWFGDAAVNTMILVLERTDHVRRQPVAVARLTVTTTEAAARVTEVRGLPAVADVRSVDAASIDQWSAALRASPMWFDFVDTCGEALVPLSDLADIRRGLTSGANDVFYLSRARAAVLELESDVLVPLVRSPRERTGQSIVIDPDDTENVVLMCPPGSSELRKYPAAERYLTDHAHCSSRPTLRARSPWWALPGRPARLFLTKAYASRFIQRFARVPVVADQRLYAVHPKDGLSPECLAAVLNSTFTAFALESLGRASLGEGALEWTVGDARQLPVLDPRRLDGAQTVRLVEAFEDLARRPAGPVQGERDAADRRRLDCALAAGSTSIASTITSVHRALCESVARRDSRSRSAGRTR